MAILAQDKQTLPHPLLPDLLVVWVALGWMTTSERHGRKRARNQEWTRESEGLQESQRMPFPARKGPILHVVEGRENRNLCHVVESREMQLEDSRCTVACQCCGQVYGIETGSQFRSCHFCDHLLVGPCCVWDDLSDELRVRFPKEAVCVCCVRYHPPSDDE